MQFENIFTEKRIGYDKLTTGSRSGFQRDYDRLIFSSAFRRLQNKTQVFPLPGSAFVHNRLTHSLEVASVGRSLVKMCGERISQLISQKQEDAIEFYKYELANVIAAGCLAHDIGNPAFGHSGEKAISNYFIENKKTTIDGLQLMDYFNQKEWEDLCRFEGNANAIRVLTHQFRGRFKGGFGLTYTTIGSIIKYPCESTAINNEFRHRKKYGFFQSEKEMVKEICTELGMIKELDDPIVFKRHPFVYLVEAADDICYNIVDMEDAHRLGILKTQEISDAFMNLVGKMTNQMDTDRTYRNYKNIEDASEGIAFLRARVINLLTNEAVDVFWNYKEKILEGMFNNTLIDEINQNSNAFNDIQKVSIEKIYEHETVVQIEIAGYNVMSELLQLFVPALLKKVKGHKEQKILSLFPYQFTDFYNLQSAYDKVLNAVDFISGMTDEYATEMYRRLKGISIPRH